jgi:hypothetical protein
MNTKSKQSVRQTLTAASAILAAAGGGSLADIETTVAMSAEDAKATFEPAGNAARDFRSAGRS